ncbi:hypothetical protein ACFO5X_12855 [Seohaeicola nanhaiensis]|uniref:Uncharacterized protein n=1 Tax=Seohaeicola nanhaiensis TaxID=1387282 RepID=A0ABV9KH05_9RHOB
MARNLFRGAPELSRLVIECPETMIDEFLRHPQFSEFLPVLMAENDPNADAASDDGPVMRIKTLKDDRIKLLETEAMRITAMAEREPDIMLRKLSEHRRFGDLSEMRQVQDALQRSLWAFCNAVPLFEAAKRAMQVKVYRDHGRVYQSWSIDASIPIGTEDIDDVKLVTEIADRLQHGEGCHVDAIELPIGDGVAPEILVAVTFFGPYSSQKTVRPNKKTELVYFRPPDELLLVYSQRRQLIEVCARDATERREVANIFAGETLRHDLSNKPLTQKNFDLSRFRRSLKLPIPDQEAHRVRSASITEVQIALGDWTKKVALTVAPDKDIDTTAREVFGKVIPGTGGGYITRVGFHIEYSGPKGKSGSLKFQVFGRNKSNIQSERDPMKRALGYDLLEAWGVLERISGLSPRARLERLPQLMALYDLTETVVTGRLLAEIGVDAADLTSHGFLVSKGWSDVILFEDDELGEMPHYVEAGRTDGQVRLAWSPAAPVTAWLRKTSRSTRSASIMSGTHCVRPSRRLG